MSSSSVSSLASRVSTTGFIQSHHMLVLAIVLVAILVAAYYLWCPASSYQNPAPTAPPAAPTTPLPTVPMGFDAFDN